MTTMLADLSDPTPSAEFVAVDALRVNEIVARHRRLSDFMRQEDFSAVLLQQPSNFAWLTAGARNDRGGNTGSTGALFITPDARVLACSNVDTAQFFETEVSNMGFQLKERPWTEPRSVMLADLCRGRKVASDTGFPGTTDIGMRMLGLRLPLSTFDQNRMRDAARLLTHAVEATARGLKKGRTEAEIAGEVSHRLMKRNVRPERIQVLGDGRADRFRRWSYDESAVNKYCTISAIARYNGMFVGVARTVSLGDPPENLLKAFEAAALIQATGIFFSQSEWEVFEILNRVHRLYEKMDVESEWLLCDQAEVLEYEFGSVPLLPNSEYRLAAGTPIYWHPAVGSVVMGDTVLVGHGGVEVLSTCSGWPVVPVFVKGTAVEIPAILVVN